jgi:HAD superfamily hydrolase (TIGR01484 family)
VEGLATLPADLCRGLQGILCDIDDTLTWQGKLIPAAFAALGRSAEAGLRVIPVTGRPAGWADHIARMWPVDGVVAENGGLWMFMRDGRLHTGYLQDAPTRAKNRTALDALGTRILAEVPGTALASDQGFRALDLAVDFCEDVPRLPEQAIDAIVAEFESAGAQAKVSSIHVNGWFGRFNKLEGCRRLVKDLFNEELDDTAQNWLYVGDSANDEPMFAGFPYSAGVANVRAFLHRMEARPNWVTPSPGGHGFAELMDHVLAHR